MCGIQPSSFRHFKIQLWDKNKQNIKLSSSQKQFSNNTGLNPYLLSYHQTLFTIAFLLAYSLLNFHRHHQFFVNSQWMFLDF